MKKKIFNAYFISIIFIFIFIMVPQYKASATMLALSEENGGGGGGSPPPAYTPPTTVYGSISMSVDIDNSSTYTGSKTITATTSAVVNTCSNTASDLTIDGTVVYSDGTKIAGQSTKNILNRTGITGGTNTGNYTNTFTAPIDSSKTYAVLFEAKRYDQSGLGIYSSNNTLVESSGNYTLSHPLGVVDVYVNINSYGRILDMINNDTTADVGYSSGMQLVDSSGNSYSIKSTVRTLVSTTTHLAPFSVGSVTATIVARLENGSVVSAPVTLNTDIYISWYSNPSKYVNNCVCTYYKSASEPNASCGSGVGTSATPKQAAGNPYSVAESKTFKVKCDNKP